MPQCHTSCSKLARISLAQHTVSLTEWEHLSAGIVSRPSGKRFSERPSPAELRLRDKKLIWKFFDQEVGSQFQIFDTSVFGICLPQMIIMESRRLVLVFRSPTHATGEGAGDLQHPNNNCTTAMHSVFTVHCAMKTAPLQPNALSTSANNINKLTALQHVFLLLLLCTALMSLCHSWIVLQFFNNSVFDPNKQWLGVTTLLRHNSPSKL